MSCQMTVLSRCQNISSVKNFLFSQSQRSTPESETANSQEQEDVNVGWDEDWGSWNEKNNTQENAAQAMDISEEPKNGNKDYWLQNCILSLSPLNDMMAIANEDRIVLLTQKWDPDEKLKDSETKFTAAWQGSLSQERGETITAVLCLPLASQKRSSQGGPDWTCVIVGFSSGYIRMYTEMGTLLLSQLLHLEPVQKLKSRTYESPRYLGIAEQHEELVILYQKAVVAIDGFSLFQSLRACRNQVARATASGGESGIQPPPLAYKKWGLQDQTGIEDCASCGVHTPSIFDQMKTASSLSGFSASVKPTPPAASIYISTGEGPYVGFFYAVEGSTQPILSEVAYAVAHKLKSAIMSAASGWLGFGNRKTEEEEQRPKIEPGTPLSHRFSLPDKRRTGQNIVLSPNNMYVASTDSFGRVMLIDIERGIVVRMWKGYRDAQLGWIQVREETGHSEQRKEHCKVANYLVIYATRRGILEVWTAASGPRVAAFNVSKSCVLVSPGYGMMGLNNVTSRGVKMQVFQCALLDSEGTIKTIHVPFHLALSDRNNKRSRDLHLLRKLKSLLKEGTEETDELCGLVEDLLMSIKMSDIRKQAIERVLNTKYLSSCFMQKVLDKCIKNLHSKQKCDGSLDLSSRLLLKFAELQASLLSIHGQLERYNNQNLQLSQEEDNSELVHRLLGVTQTEAMHIVSEFEHFQSLGESKAHRQVQFALEDMSNVANFLECFHCSPHYSDQESNHSRQVTLKNSLQEHAVLSLGQYFYSKSLSRQSSTNDLAVILQGSSLPPEQLMNLLMVCCLSGASPTLAATPSLYHIVRTISALSTVCDMRNRGSMNQNFISKWWQKLRDCLCCSFSTHAAYLLAVVCRGVAKEFIDSQSSCIAKDPDADMASSNSENELSPDWENLAIELENWDLLVRQLEDALSISGLLNIRVTEQTGSMPKAVDPVKVSVKKLLEGGRGAVPEVIARYVARSSLLPSHLFQTTVAGGGQEEADDKFRSDPLQTLQGQLEKVRHRFPHSLESDVLLTNCCWEYAVQWNRDTEMVDDLHNALKYLTLVQNAVLRQGVGSMMWHMFIVKRMSAAAQLMEKVGKAPKDRLCRKDVGISSASLVGFMKAVCDLLKIIMEANCDVNEVPVFNMEPLWTSVQGPASLVELAIDQRPTNYGLLNHHLHLAYIMQGTLQFNLKSVKVLSLFDNKGKHAFFQDLYSHPLLPNSNVDQSISLGRRQFLSRAVTQAVHTLDSTVASPSTSPSHTKIKNVIATEWPAIVLSIAKDFELDIDFFKRHHVCELYSGGHDSLAEEILQTVNDHDLIGSQLLTIAGQRVTHLLKCDTPTGVDLLSNISPVLSTWLKSLDSTQLRCQDIDVKTTALLVGHVVGRLTEGFSEHNLAVSLVDLVQRLI